MSASKYQNYIDQELSTESVNTTDSDSEIQRLLNFGQILIHFNQHYCGALYLWQALNLSQELKRILLEARVIGRLSETYISLGVYKIALKLQTRYLEIAEEMNDNLIRISVYKSLIGLTFKLCNYDDALRYAGHLLIYSRAVNNISIENQARVCIQELRRKLGQKLLTTEEIDFIYLGIVPTDDALKNFTIDYYSEPVNTNIAMNVDNLMNLWIERNEFGNKYMIKGEQDQAIESFTENIELTQKSLKEHNCIYEAKSMLTLGICLGKIKRFNSAIRCFVNALIIVLMYDDHTLKMHIFQHLKEIHTNFAFDLDNLKSDWVATANRECASIDFFNSIAKTNKDLAREAGLQRIISSNYENLLNLEITFINSTDNLQKFEISFETGNLFFELEKYVEAEYQLINAFAIYCGLNLPGERFGIYSIMYQNYCKLNKFDEAFDILRKFMFRSDSEVNKKDIIIAYKYLCDICLQRNNHSDAIEYAKKLLTLSEKENDSDAIEIAMETINESINILYWNVIKKRLEDASKTKGYNSMDMDYLEEYYRDQLQLAIDTEDNDLEVDSLMNIAHIQFYLKDYDFAINNYEKALQLTTKLSDLLEILAALANSLFSMKNFGSALTFYKTYLDQFPNFTPSDLDYCYIYWVLSYLYLNTGDFENSAKYAELHYDLAKKTNDKGGIRVAVQNISFVKYSLSIDS